MGKVGRWLRSLLSGKNPAAESPEESPVKQKNRWGFGLSSRVREKSPSTKAVEKRVVSFSEGGGGSYDVKFVDRNKKAIAVAVATAAAAEAAVASAHAAATVVRLTSSCRGPAALGKKEEWAATQIQAAFRGHLARKALRALKGLVKLQALVKGHIVRKQAAQTLHCMQALVRVQARARARRLMTHSNCSPLSPTQHHGPDTLEKYESSTRVNRTRSQRALSSAKSEDTSPCYADSVKQKNRVKPKRAEAGIMDPGGPWSWLDRWMDGRAGTTNSGDDERRKILEVDPGKAQFTTKRRNRPYSHSINSRSLSFTATPASPSKDSAVVQLSSPSLSSVDMTSRFRTGRDPGNSIFRCGTQAAFPLQKGETLEFAESEFSGCIDYPNYMANTESWRAKARSQSVPRLRPAAFEKCSSVRRMPLYELADLRSNASTVISQRSSSLHAKFTSKAYPGSGRLDRLLLPVRAGGDVGCRNY